MSASNLERSIELVFGHEGGYVNNPNDPGGPTKYGITQKTLSAWRGKKASVADVKALTLAEASKILRDQYWDAIWGDDLPSGLDHAAFDYAVNSGPAQATKTLQRVVGSTPDGVMGARTLAAVEARDTAKTIDGLCDARLTFLRGLKTWKNFGKGWSSRVERVRKEAKAMIGGGKPLQLAAPTEGTAQANPADTKALATADGQGAAWAAVGVAGTAFTEAANQIAPFTEAMPVLRALFVVLTVVGIGIGLYATMKRIKAGNAA